MLLQGCVTEESRAARQKKYSRLYSLPPAEPVPSSNEEVSICAQLSCDLFNEVHPLMKAYVDKIDSNREYISFMNDVRYYVEEEKMSNADAIKKVVDAVIAADVNLPDKEKLWPKIQKGVAATKELDPKTQLIKLTELIARSKNVTERVAKLPVSFMNESLQDKFDRVRECFAIGKQLADVKKCLIFLVDQYLRVVELENSSK